ncbi:MAG: hypothetical protein P8077_08735, partial [Gammaproteobacteria bacterium]
LREPPPCDFTVTDFAQTVLTITVNHGGFASRLRFLAPDWVQQLRLADPITWQYLALIRIQVNGLSTLGLTDINTTPVATTHRANQHPFGATLPTTYPNPQPQTAQGAPIDRHFLSNSPHFYLLPSQRQQDPHETHKQTANNALEQQRFLSERSISNQTTPEGTSPARSTHRSEYRQLIYRSVTHSKKPTESNGTASTQHTTTQRDRSPIDRSPLEETRAPVKTPAHTVHTLASDPWSTDAGNCATLPQAHKPPSTPAHRDNMSTLRRLIHTAIPGKSKR